MRTHRFRPAMALMAFMVALIPVTVLGFSVPDTVNLNSSGKLYEPFTFNHAKHIQSIKECSDCHHHTTGTLITDPNCIRCHRNSSESKDVSCRGCHSADPFSVASLRDRDINTKIYHLDKPGLKGAMHQNCIGCHTANSKGPIGCVDCHKRKPEGNAFYNSGEFTPKVKTGKGEHH